MNNTHTHTSTVYDNERGLILTLGKKSMQKSKQDDITQRGG